MVIRIYRPNHRISDIYTYARFIANFQTLDAYATPSITSEELPHPTDHLFAHSDP